MTDKYQRMFRDAEACWKQAYAMLRGEMKLAERRGAARMRRMAAIVAEAHAWGGHGCGLDAAACIRAIAAAPPKRRAGKGVRS